MLLVERIQSGEATEMTRQDWEDVRREAVKQFEGRGSQGAAVCIYETIGFPQVPRSN